MTLNVHKIVKAERIQRLYLSWLYSSMTVTLLHSTLLIYGTSFLHSLSRWSLTDAGRKRIIPGPPLSCHAFEHTAAVQCVSGVALVGDGAAREMALVVDLEAKLGHPRVLTVRKLKTWKTLCLLAYWWLFDYRLCQYFLKNRAFIVLFCHLLNIPA